VQNKAPFLHNYVPARKDAFSKFLLLRKRLHSNCHCGYLYSIKRRLITLQSVAYEKARMSEEQKKILQDVEEKNFSN